MIKLTLAEKFMQKTGKTGFYNIMPISNLESVLKKGILSYDQAISMPHSSVAMDEIQSRRNNVCVPNGMKLHKYANVYLDARNPMLFKRKEEDVCVLKISLDILDLPNVVVADRNASSNYARFIEPQHAFDVLNFDLIYAQYWIDDDPLEYIKRKAFKCAEILVPQCIAPEFIIAVAVRNEQDEERVISTGFNKKIYVDKYLFFEQGGAI